MGDNYYLAMEIITYLGKKYAIIDPHELEENHNKLSDPFGMYKPILVYPKKLQNIQDLDEEGKQPISDSILAMAVYNFMK